ncbi:MAG: hypothetical protein ACRELY_05860 [Polyangiaceae bacterium]
MSEDFYREDWARFRRYAAWSLGLMPAMMLVPFFAAIFNRELAAVHLLVPAFVLTGALFVAFFVANYKLRQFRCPCCNHLWMVNTGLFAKCRVCGIVRGAPSP